MIYDCVGSQIMVDDIIMVAMTSYNDPYFNVYRVTEVIEDTAGPYGQSKIKGRMLYSRGRAVSETTRASTLTRGTRGFAQTVMIINETILQQMLQQN